MDPQQVWRSRRKAETYLPPLESNSDSPPVQSAAFTYLTCNFVKMLIIKSGEFIDLLSDY
jgi:hypothetical protein